MSIFKNIFSSLQMNSAEDGRVVGIDIGSSSLKVVELQDKKGVVTLSTYGEIQLGPYAGKDLGESVTLEAKQEQEALVDIFREASVKAKKAVFAMPLSSSFVTNVTVKAEPDTDISAMVRVEARKVIPASLSEVTLDWAEVDVTKQKNKKKDENEHNVLIAAIQNSALDRFKILMQFVGVKQPPTEIECFSAIRGLYSSTIPDFALVDIGASSTKLYISRNGLLMRMYRIRAGGALATKRIAEALGVSFAEAETLKYQADKSNNNFTELKRAHDSSYDRAFREFSQVLREYERKTGNQINQVYLSGGGAMFPGINKQLSDALGKEVEMSNPFKKVAYPAFMEDVITEIGPSFTVALGAALRNFE